MTHRFDQVGSAADLWERKKKKKSNSYAQSNVQSLPTIEKQSESPIGAQAFTPD